MDVTPASPGCLAGIRVLDLAGQVNREGTRPLPAGYGLTGAPSPG